MTPQDSTSELREAITMKLGEATMCWEPIPSGVFDSERAVVISDDIMNLIQANNRTIIERCMEGLPEKKQPYRTVYNSGNNKFQTVSSSYDRGVNEAIDQITAHLRKLLEDV